MAYEFLGQILAGIIISGLILIGPSVVLFCGWREWRSNILKSDLPAWGQITASIGILSISGQTILFIALLITIFHFKNLVPHRFFLSACVFAELVLLLIAGPCMFGWRGRFRWWLLASSIYLPVLSFFSVLAVMAQ
jgi:hypothetical protein